VQFPFALPPLFAALRATAPLAITGAMLAEFFLTGTGLGSSLNLARNQFKYNSMWSQAAIATLFSVLIYALAVGVEGAVLARFAPDRAKAAKVKA
jgi:ABC-type nitrate/sulfonate/bicarbonate transport system permease component